MSTGLSTALALLLYGAAAAPFVWIALRPRSVSWLAPAVGVLVLGLALVQTGLFKRDALASTDVAPLVQASATQGRCQEIFEVLTENGFLLQPPGEEGPMVRGEAWDQLPQPIQDAVEACAETLPSPTGEAGRGDVFRR